VLFGNNLTIARICCAAGRKHIDGRQIEDGNRKQALVHEEEFAIGTKGLWVSFEQIYRVGLVNELAQNYLD
jgi:hypothetical protein